MISLDANVWRRHGPHGLLMQRLARYALLGWVLFGCAALAFVVLAVVAVWRTPPIIAVDRAGTVLGRIQWLGAVHRSRREIITASMRFLQDYLSVNSATVVPDYIQALDMMAPPLRATTVAILRETAYLARVRAARLRSWVSFAKSPNHPRLARRDGRRFLVRLSGVLHVVLPNGRRHNERFTLILTEVAVARRMHDTAGILIEAIAAP
ncbi:hypothetical protein [Acidiferrobacter sp.]|jgi:hypothetical protein|uniref:hypothetical protein n=1 Tax=Acidiferrobacter sp. TaxID=1872107 RepID=UPI002619AB2D|nr:hypothetical protein [Acidiferrobacter sp.]